MPLEQSIVFGSTDELGCRALTDRELLGKVGNGCLGGCGDLDEQEEFVPFGGQAVLAHYPFAMDGERAEGPPKIGRAVVVLIGGVSYGDLVRSA